MWSELSILGLWLALSWAVSAEIRARVGRKRLRIVERQALSLAEDFSALQREHREKRLRQRSVRSAAGVRGHETRRRRAEVAVRAEGSEVHHG